MYASERCRGGAPHSAAELNENARLKKLVAEQALDSAIIKEISSGRC
jgi:hypothetical protein